MRGKHYAWYTAGPPIHPREPRWSILYLWAWIGYYWDRVRSIPEDLHD